MKTRIITLILLCFCTNSFACLNEYQTLLTGKVVYISKKWDGKISPNKIDTLTLKNKAKQLLVHYERTDSIQYLSDYAAALTYLGSYQKAKKIYEQIEIKQPHLYTTASNLGTLYELIGKPDSALIWIKKSIQLNPNSHEGSEWIHIKILEFKLSSHKDYNKSILDLDFGTGDIPTNAHEYDLEKLRNHIWGQLKERITFIKPPNQLVGSIYFEFGNVLAQTQSVQAALNSYEEAKKYGFDSPLMRQRSIKFQQLALKAEPDKQLEQFKDFVKAHLKLLFGLVAIVSMAILIAIIRFFTLKERRRYE